MQRLDYKTEHYVFHCVNNKTAERDIETIAKRQEEAYADITAVLNVRYDFTINYYLVNTPEEVAKMTGYPYPVNGLACFSDKSVYAVYSDDVKCIGPHEDAHLISETIGTPDSDFLCEGLAMYFDKRWWGVDNRLWCRYFIETRAFVAPITLLNNREFDKVDCSVSYPIAGAFTAYLIEKLGIDKYKHFYALKNINDISSESALYKELRSISDDFIDSIKNISMTDAEKEHVKTVYELNMSD